MIQFKHVKIGYSAPIIGIEDLTLMKGQVYALVGANGAGKTTLLNSMIQAKQPLSGTIQIEEKALESFTSKELSKTIAYIGTRFEGVEYLTVLDYLRLGRTPYTDTLGRLSEEDYHAIEKAIQFVGITELLDRDTSHLSDGERQLISIARALVQNTPVLILDEPTAYLDYANRKRISKLLKKIASDENKCIIFSTHDIELCLEEDLNILLIDLASKQLSSCIGSISKSEILRSGFNYE